MAEKRMFSKKVIDTDWFMEMPASAQNLYFHLSMRADDDGFVASPKRIMRLVGASDDDYKLLMAKKFIIPFESGVCVIVHWRINNYLRNDRYTETIYKQEKESLLVEENNEYTLGIPNGIPLGIPSVSPVYTTSISNSISNSNSISKSNSINETNSIESNVTDTSNNKINNNNISNVTYIDSSFEIFWKEYPKKVDKKGCYRSFKRIPHLDSEFDKIMEALRRDKQSKQWKENKGQFIPHPTTYINQERWKAEVEAVEQDDSGYNCSRFIV